MVKGDWAQTIMTLNSIYTWASVQPCWLCLAYKKDGPPTMRFTCVGDTETWSQTVGQRTPWTVPPSICGAIGFTLTPTSVPIDVLHAYFLGVGRDLAAGSIVELCAHIPGGARAQRLSVVTGRFRQWRRNCKVSTRVKKFTVGNLKWKGKQYPSLSCKGADCRRVIDFLASCDFSFDPLLQTTLQVASEWAQLQFSADTFFIDSERERFASLSKVLVRGYLALSVAKPTHFRVRPKLHLLQHVLHMHNLNPHVSATWLDEDLIGKAMRLFRRLRCQAIERRSLERYWLGMKGRLKHLRGRFEPPSKRSRD
jgi:hypothetical protein